MEVYCINNDLREVHNSLLEDKMEDIMEGKQVVHHDAQQQLLDVLDGALQQQPFLDVNILLQQ